MDMTFDAAMPLLGIAAWSGTGKTTLLEALLPMLQARGLNTAVVKHAHHAFDIDKPGKDSYRLREAGAAPILIASHARSALMINTPGQQEPDLSQLLNQLKPLAPDLVLVEGFKSWPLPKLELHRKALGKPLLVTDDPWVHAVASPDSLVLPAGVETLDLDDHQDMCEWILAWQRGWPSMAAPRMP